MKVLAAIMEKGGVGKTTTATTIAAGLAIAGQRVLVIDADGQGHATRLLGAKLRPGLYDLLVRDADWQDELITVNPSLYTPNATGVLSLLPGNHETMFIPQAISDPFLLQQRIDELKDVYDVVIIDTSPTPSLLNASILMATDYAIVPTKMEYLSLQSLTSTMRTIEGFSGKRVSGGLSPVKAMGIIPTAYRANTREHFENLEQVKATHKALVWPAIADRIVWTEASVRQQSIFVHAPMSKAADEAWTMVNNVAEAIYG